MQWAHLPDVIIVLCVDLVLPLVLPMLALVERRCRAPSQARLRIFLKLIAPPFVISPRILLGYHFEERYTLVNYVVNVTSMDQFARATRVGALPFLKSLRLDRVVWRTVRPKSWAVNLSAALLHLPLLEQLQLNDNLMCDDCIESLASAIVDGACRALVDLSLCKNSIGCRGITAFMTALLHRGRGCNLRRIHAASNLIADEGFGAIAGLLDRLPRLQELRLEYNHIGNAGLCSLSTMLWVPSGVQDFVPSYLAGTSLTWLDLSANNVGDNGARAFAVKIGEGAVPRLQQLHLHNNQIGESGLCALMSSLDTRASAFQAIFARGNFTPFCRLREVYLGGNNVSPDWMEENIYVSLKWGGGLVRFCKFKQDRYVFAPRSPPQLSLP